MELFESGTRHHSRATAADTVAGNTTLSLIEPDGIVRVNVWVD
jgi:hypothetical protein